MGLQWEWEPVKIPATSENGNTISLEEHRACIWTTGINHRTLHVDLAYSVPRICHYGMLCLEDFWSLLVLMRWCLGYSGQLG